jgi:N-acetylmuramoyl-L-alanine amidase
MSTSCFHIAFRRTAKILAVAVAIGIAFVPDPLPAADTIVFLDPGHGGQDTGARGAGGLLEKNVVLALAKRIEKDLGQRFSVRLSRNDDYALELFHRTETANSLSSSLFISLHTGGAFNYSTGGLAVYYFLDSPGRILPEDIAEDSAFDTGAGPVPWHSVQYRHATESRLLSQFLQASLAGVDDASGCRTAGAPLLALSAADMPAVLIEVGSLNNPAEEERLADPENLDRLAEAISEGIKNFLGRSSDITSIDLHE